MREYALKLDYIQPCTPEFLEKMKKFDADLADFITEKQKQAAEGKVANTGNPAGLVNGTIDTNVGLLRAYMTLYLKRHPLSVRTCSDGAHIGSYGEWPARTNYCFSSNKNWPSYESIQAEIMEHFCFCSSRVWIVSVPESYCQRLCNQWFDRVWQGPFYCRRNSLAFGLAKGRKGIVRDLNIY